MSPGASICFLCRNTMVHPGFIALRDAVPGVVQDIRYATENNFTGRPVDGYPQPCGAVLTREAAATLAAVANAAQAKGMQVCVYDAYRPQRAVDAFVAWAARRGDELAKAAFFPNVPKGELFARGFIAERSGHSRGSTVDLTLLRDGEALDMGSPFDFFGPESASTSTLVNAQQQANRCLLRTLMEQHGWLAYEPEWWHFTLANEPFPTTFFDF